MKSELILHEGYMVRTKESKKWSWVIYHGTYFWDEGKNKRLENPTEWWCHNEGRWIKWN